MCDQVPRCRIRPMRFSQFPAWQWGGEAIGRKAAAQPATGRMWIDKAFFESLSPAAKLAFYLHEIAHLEGCRCESCADTRAGEWMRALKIKDDREAVDAFVSRLQNRSGQKAGADFHAGFSGSRSLARIDGADAMAVDLGTLGSLDLSSLDLASLEGGCFPDLRTHGLDAVDGPIVCSDIQPERVRLASLGRSYSTLGLDSGSAEAEIANELATIPELAQHTQRRGAQSISSSTSIAEDIAAAAVRRRPQDARRFAWLLASIGKAESQWGKALDEDGTNSSGDDYGEMQINESAHPDMIARTLSDGSAAWLDRRQNVDMGAEVLAHALARYPNNLKAAVASYNAGEQGVANVMAHGQDPDTATGRSAYPGYYARNVLAQIAEWGKADALTDAGASPPTVATESAFDKNAKLIMWGLLLAFVAFLVYANTGKRARRNRDD